MSSITDSGSKKTGAAGAKHGKRKRAVEKPEERMERVVQVSRVTKVVKGGKRLGFRALIVAGDKGGSVGVGIGKAAGVPNAIQKGIAKAKKNQIKFPMVLGTIPHQILGICGASKVLLRPAPPGTGVIAGGAVRTVLEMAGVVDIVSKSQGSSNAINVAKATVNALERLMNSDAISLLRGKPISIRQYSQSVQPLTSESVTVVAQGRFEKIVTPAKSKKEKIKAEEKIEAVKVEPVPTEAPATSEVAIPEIPQDEDAKVEEVKREEVKIEEVKEDSTNEA